MRLPNKIISYDESILAKFPIVLNAVEKSDISVYVLFSKLKEAFEDIGEFIKVLDCLYALGTLELEAETRLLRYVGRDNMR